MSINYTSFKTCHNGENRNLSSYNEHSYSYKYNQNFSGDKFTSSNSLASENQPQKRGVFNTWINKIIGYKTECTDKKDDGKLSFGEKLKSIGRGILNLGTNLIDSLLEKPVQTIGITAATVLGSAAIVAAGIISAPALAIIGSGIGLAIGGVQIIKNISTASKATTDAEAKQAYESIGEGGATVLLSSVTMGKGINKYKTELNTAKTNSAASAKSAQESAESAIENVTKSEESLAKATESAESALSSAKSAKNSAKESLKIAEEYSDSTIDNASILANNSANEALNAANNAQEALSATNNNTILSYSEAGETIKHAQEASQAAQTANKSFSLLKAQKAAKAGKTAAEQAKLSSERTTLYAQQAEEFSSKAGEAAEIAQNASSKAAEHLDTAVKKALENWIPEDESINIVGYSGTKSNSSVLYNQLAEDNKWFQEGLYDDILEAKSVTLSYKERTQMQNNGIISSSNFSNAAVAPDASGIRGQLPIKNGRFRSASLQELKENGIERVIDFRGKLPEDKIAENVLQCKKYGLEYHNIPVEYCSGDKNLQANITDDLIKSIPEYIQEMRKGNYYAGCANGCHRTDLGMAINFLFNPESTGGMKLVGGCPKGRVIASTRDILERIDDLETFAKSLGWNDGSTMVEAVKQRLSDIV